MLKGLEAFATELEARLRAEVIGESRVSVPYGIFLGGSPCMQGLERTHRWHRLVSWFDHDRRLFAAGLHLDRSLCELAPELATRTSDSRCASAPSVRPRTTWADALASSKARYLCFSVMAAVEAHRPDLSPISILPVERRAEYRAWGEARRIDDEATAIMRGWATESPARIVRKVDVTYGIDYPLVRDLLERHYRVFGGER